MAIKHSAAHLNVNVILKGIAVFLNQEYHVLLFEPVIDH